jgi:hypothetical protein
MQSDRADRDFDADATCGAPLPNRADTLEYRIRRARELE